jgi:PPOX class probable F420-dependent enzyme
MPSRRDQVAMTPGEVREFLANGRTLVLVTYGPDGLPDPVPMWYVVDGDGVPLMRTYTRSQKVVNIARDPRAAGLVEDGERYAALRGVQLTGRVETFDDTDAILDVVTRLAVKYEGLSPSDATALRESARPVAAKWTGLRLVADRVASWDHGKLGGTY